MSDPNMAYRGLPGMGYICDGSVFDVWIFYFQFHYVLSMKTMRVMGSYPPVVETETVWWCQKSAVKERL